MFKKSIKFLCTGLAISLLMACTDSNSFDNAVLHAGYANEFYKAKNYTKAIDECSQAISYMEQGQSASSLLTIIFSPKINDAVLGMKAFCHTLNADSYSNIGVRDKAVELIIMANVEWEEFLKHYPDQMKMVDEKGEMGVSVRDVFKKLEVKPKF